MELFHQQGYTAKMMARHFGCSTQLVYKRLYEEGIKMRDRYSSAPDDVYAKVKDLHEQFPNSGSEVHNYYLESHFSLLQRDTIKNMWLL